MVVRGWIGTVATAAGVAAATGAAQLGLGYGMGIVSWLPDGGGLSDDAWVAGLTWAAWICATSAIAGAVVADRLSSAPASTPAVDTPVEADRLTVVLWRLVLAVAAALGALLPVVLIAVPARAVEVTATSSPQTIAAGYAILGVLVGLFFAAVALTARAVAANLVATAAWLWLFAVVAVVDQVAAGGDWDRVPLAFWDFTGTEPWFRNILLADAGPVLGAALVIGALAALPAARRGDSPAAVATSGVAGPLVLAAAYLLTQPSLVGAGAQELSRHLVVPYVVLAGLIGSLLISMVRPRAARRARPAIGTAAVGTAVGTASPAPDPVPLTVPAQREPASA